MTYGITGATGQLGRHVVEQLRQEIGAESIIALVRNPERAADLGVQARSFDYNQPEALAAALAGVDVLLLISANEVGRRLEQHSRVIAAAREAGVKRILYTSILHADTTGILLAEEHLATEKLIAESGIPATILRNGWYTENYLGSLGAVLANGGMIGSGGGGKISVASRADYAAAAVRAMLSTDTSGKVLELAGDTPVTPEEIAAEISRQTGREIPYHDLPEEKYAEILAGFGLPAALASALAGSDTRGKLGDLHNDSRQLSTLIGRPTTPLSVTVAEALAALPAA